ncbi:ty3-gypsy retrotransposon protein [Striga asiatica]|uniref:Ty3-gypsy retrotransposon protein n=1 Tax=Striga asiatica TaxID=4170 RepID=A0A5A7P018_STRAF|nr:ty3-gypsy retrotransposon protein [Striga asiatica]
MLRPSAQGGRGDASVADYERHNDLLLYRGRVFVPNEGQLREKILQHFHNSKLGGHSGFYRTWARMVNTFFWPRHQGTVRDYVARCDECQRTKADARWPGGLLQPFSAQGFGRTSRWISLKDCHWTELSMSSAYHPQTNGQTEVINCTLEQYLRCYVHQFPNQWDGYLPWAEYWYNTTYHSSTTATPFELVYGRKPPTLVSYAAGSAINDESVPHSREKAILGQPQVGWSLPSIGNKMKEFIHSSRTTVHWVHIGKNGVEIGVLMAPNSHQTSLWLVGSRARMAYSSWTEAVRVIMQLTCADENSRGKWHSQDSSRARICTRELAKEVTRAEMNFAG